MTGVTPDEDRPAARRVLVVDDDRDFADSLANFLTMANYVVSVAYGVEQAETAAEWFEPDLALVDYALGPANGLNLAKSLKARRPGLACVVMSAHADPAIAERVLSQGILEYQLKPLEMDGLLATIERGIRSTA